VDGCCVSSLGGGLISSLKLYILAFMDITVSTVSSILTAQISLIKNHSMNSNINDLFTLTDYESDTSIHRNATKLASTAGVTSEMQSLGFSGEVVGAAVRPSVLAVKVDLTDWANAIR
jgi:hypothetical protein